MHYHCEIVIPNATNVESAVERILAPFNENDKEALHPFYDWYQIGGRYSGTKEMAKYDKVRLEKFNQLLIDKNITVSGFVAGKESISPEDQISDVDKLWREAFPESPLKSCPFFKHSGERLHGDIMLFSEVPDNLEMYHIIFANKDGGKYEANNMYLASIWNGLAWQDTNWNGTFAGAVKLHLDKTSGYRDDYRNKVIPAKDWIVVTIDYHS